jgi:hypothetical protein
MEYSDYLREQAAEYRQLAEEAEDPARGSLDAPTAQSVRAGRRATVPSGPSCAAFTP